MSTGTNGERPDVNPEVNEALQERLRDGQIGVPYTDQEHGLSISGDASEITMKVEPEHAQHLRINDVVLIYDFQKSLWIGGQVSEIATPRVGESDRNRKLYQETSESMVDLLNEGHQEAFGIRNCSRSSLSVSLRRRTGCQRPRAQAMPAQC